MSITLQDAYRLVGQFLHEWGLLEMELRDALQKALGLTALQAAIVGSNTQLRDKLHILRTAVNLAAIPKEEQENYNTTLNQIATYSTTRNMMAHDAFFPSVDGKGVRFFVIKAKGNFDIPHVVWDERKFQEEFDKIAAFTKTIEKLSASFENSNLARALHQANMHQPKPGLFGLGALGLLNLPVQELHTLDTNPATPETTSQTQPSEND